MNFKKLFDLTFRCLRSATSCGTWYPHGNQSPVTPLQVGTGVIQMQDLNKSDDSK